MASRDVEINLIAHDRTGQATRSAANNLEQLARKVEKAKNQTTIKPNNDHLKITPAEIKRFEAAGKKSARGFGAGFNRQLRELKLDAKYFGSKFANVAKRVFGQQGRKSGTSFVAGFIKAITFGQIGQGFAHAAIRAAPAAAKIGGLLGAAMAAALVVELVNAVSAAAPLLLGGALLAAPVAFLIHQQLQGLKQVTVEEKKIATLKKNLELAKGKAAKDRIRGEIAAEQRILAEQKLQGGALLKLKNQAKSFLNYISKPIRIPFAQALGIIGKGLKNVRHDARGITTALGTGLKGFTTGAMVALQSFIKAIEPAIPNVVASFKEWGRVLPQITTSIANLLTRITGDTGSIQAFADSFDGLSKSAGNVVQTLQEVSTTIVATGNQSSTAKLKFYQWYDDLLQGVKHQPGPNDLFGPIQAAVHAQRLALEGDMKAIEDAKHQTDRALSESAKVAGARNAVNVLKDLKKGVQDRLKTAKGKAKFKLELDLSHFNTELAIARANLHTLQKTRSKPKLEADKSNLEAAIRDINAKLKKVHNKKTRAKLEADKTQAEAALTAINARLNALDHKVAKPKIVVTTYYRYSGKTTGSRPGGPAGSKHGGQGGTTAGSADFGWTATGGLDGGSSMRTQPPTPISVAAPIVDTRVFLDSREVAAIMRSTIVDENRRNAYRSRTGRR